MKRFLLCFIVFATMFTIIPMANAGPANPITRIAIKSIGYTANGSEIVVSQNGEGINNNNNPITGNTLYVKVQYIGGQRSYEYIRVNGQVIPSSQYTFTLNSSTTGGQTITYNIPKSALRLGGDFINQLVIEGHGGQNSQRQAFIQRIYMR